MQETNVAHQARLNRHVSRYLAVVDVKLKILIKEMQETNFVHQACLN